jgi:hypothetical protein
VNDPGILATIVNGIGTLFGVLFLIAPVLAVAWGAWKYHRSNRSV